MNLKRMLKEKFVDKKIENERTHEEELNLKGIYPKFATPLTKEEVENTRQMWGGC